MKRSGDLVALALQRIGHAPAVIGQLEIHGHSEMSPCWRPLLIALAESVQVSWIAGPRTFRKAKGVEDRAGDGTSGRAADGAILLREPAS